MEGGFCVPTILNVARYVLEKCGELTTMKLQKIAYYCQAWSLAWDEEPLFQEDFEAWANGPVCRVLYENHRGHYRIKAESLPENMPGVFTETQIETMDTVIDYYGDKKPHWLSELTHTERPWKDARKGYAPGQYCDEIITKESMQEYYGGLIGEQE
jgi:uncharacterized phage-associated protein